MLIFGADMSSLVHVDNMKLDILVLCKGPVEGLDNKGPLDGLDDTLLIAEK